MQLAVNYTPQAADLLAAGRVTCDLYKCPDWPDVVAEAARGRPVYVHFPLHAGCGALDDVDWRKIESFLNNTMTRFVNVHLAPAAWAYPGMEPDTRDPVWRERIIERLLRDIDQVTARFGAENVILENVPWDPDPKYLIPRPAIEPELVCHVVRETGCGFLLDIAHAYIAALHLEIDPVAYLDSLPVENLREIHITGTLFDAEAGYWRDHFPMTAVDWRLAEHALNCVKSGDWPAPEIVALEYGGVGPLFEWRSEKAVIERELNRLAEMLAAADSSPRGEGR